MKKLFVCEDTLNAMYSAIYDAWRDSRTAGDNGIRLEGRYDTELFCEYVPVEVRVKKREAVEKMIWRNLGEEVAGELYLTLLSEADDKADVVLGTLQTARYLKEPGRILEYLSNDRVARVFELSRRVGNEAHMFIEVVRFRELKQGILFSEIHPENRILSCLGEHFSDRFPQENWMIRDKTHDSFLIHEKGKRWILAEHPEIREELLKETTEGEMFYAELYRRFCQTIAIRERTNLRCQQNHLPLRYRKDMVEFAEETRRNCL